MQAGRANGVLRLHISDDGVGGAAPGPGSGLRGMRDRVESLGGTLALRSGPGEGTVVSVEVPPG
jgi:signal transduction histidine kinase